MTSAGSRRMGGRRSSAKDVAELAGVSVTTVSRVFNGPAGLIPLDTEKRVRDAAVTLKYRPNTLARALRQGRTQTIGLVVPDISDAYFHQIARGVEDAAQKANYTVIIANTDRRPEKEMACVNLMLDKNVDAIIFAGGGIDGDDHLTEYDWTGTYVITIGPHRLPFPAILADDEAALATATRHLAEQGRSRILCLAGQPNWLVAQSRLTGYRQAVLDLGLHLDDRLIVFGGFDEQSGITLTEQAIADGVDFDGLIAFNDYAAIGAISALGRQGKNVPDDVAVVGCDDTPLARLVAPSLTSIRFPQYKFGEAAAKIIIGERQPQQDPLMFPYELVIRESSLGKTHSRVDGPNVSPFEPESKPRPRPNAAKLKPNRVSK